MKPTTALCCFGFLLTCVLFGSSSSQSGEWTPSVYSSVRSCVYRWSGSVRKERSGTIMHRAYFFLLLMMFFYGCNKSLDRPNPHLLLSFSPSVLNPNVGKRWINNSLRIALEKKGLTHSALWYWDTGDGSKQMAGCSRSVVISWLNPSQWLALSFFVHRAALLNLERKGSILCPSHVSFRYNVDKHKKWQLCFQTGYCALVFPPADRQAVYCVYPYKKFLVD